MATLGKIREHSIFLLVVVGVAMAAFIIGDLITSSSSIMQSSRDKVVAIDGQKVTYEQFETARQQRTEFYKSLLGRDVDGDASQQLTQEVYNQFVTEALMNEICDEYSIAVTKSELSDLAQGDNLSSVLLQLFGQQAHQVSSFFIQTENSDNWEEVGQQMPWCTQQNWDFIKKQMVFSRKMEKFQSLIATAVKPAKFEAEGYFNDDNEEATFAFVRQTVGQVADSLVKVSSSDLKDYYESTKRQWKIQSARRNISYIAVPLRPSQADFAEAEQDINNMRNEFATTDDIAELVNSNSVAPYADAFVAVRDLDPETREFVEHNEKGAILEPHRTQGTYYMMARILDKTTAPDSVQITAVVVPTQEEADSLKAVVAAAADTDMALASYDPQQKFSGWVNDIAALQNFGAEMRDAINAAAKGQTFTKTITVGTQSAYYVVKVTDKTAPVAKAKVAVYATEVTPSSTTRREEFGKLNQFMTSFKTIRAMEDSAMNYGYTMFPTILSNTAYNIGQVSDARQAVRFAFQGEVGEVSEIYEAGENLLVVGITGQIEEGFSSLNDSTFQKQISTRVRQLKKADYLVDQFNAVSDKSLEGYAASLGVTVDTARFANFNSRSIMGLGNEPAIVEAALKAQPNQVVVAKGRNTVAAVKLIEKQSKGKTYDQESEGQAMQSLERSSEYSQAVNGALAVLQYNAKIEDNRISFY